MNVKPGQVYRDDLNPNAFHRVVAVDERGIWTRPHRSPHASASLTNPGWFKVWHLHLDQS